MIDIYIYWYHWACHIVCFTRSIHRIQAASWKENALLEVDEDSWAIMLVEESSAITLVAVLVPSAAQYYKKTAQEYMEIWQHANFRMSIQYPLQYHLQYPGAKGRSLTQAASEGALFRAKTTFQTSHCCNIQSPLYTGILAMRLALGCSEKIKSQAMRPWLSKLKNKYIHLVWMVQNGTIVQTCTNHQHLRNETLTPCGYRTLITLLYVKHWHEAMAKLQRLSSSACTSAL